MTNNKKIVRQFCVVASDGRIVCIENKATPSSAKRIARNLGCTYRVMESVNDGAGFSQFRDVAGV
jgi:hypothetical protein